MAAYSFLRILRLWMVDGIGAGLQWRRRYQDTDVHQSCLFLVDPDTPLLLSCAHNGLATIGSLLGSLYIGDVCGLVYALVVFEREVENCESLKEKKEKLPPVSRHEYQMQGARSVQAILTGYVFFAYYCRER